MSGEGSRRRPSRAVGCCIDAWTATDRGSFTRRGAAAAAGRPRDSDRGGRAEGRDMEEHGVVSRAVLF